MEKLFLLRHAMDEDNKDDNPALSEMGIIQAKKLAENIEANLIGDNRDITIWTSSAKRAKETALIVFEKFPNATFVEYQKLWSDRNHKHDFNWLVNQLDNFQGKILIIITHLDYVCFFPEEKLGFKDIRAYFATGLLIEDAKQSKFG